MCRHTLRRGPYPSLRVEPGWRGPAHGTPATQILAAGVSAGRGGLAACPASRPGRPGRVARGLAGPRTWPRPTEGPHGHCQWWPRRSGGQIRKSGMRRCDSDKHLDTWMKNRKRAGAPASAPLAVAPAPPVALGAAVRLDPARPAPGPRPRYHDSGPARDSDDITMAPHTRQAPHSDDPQALQHPARARSSRRRAAAAPPPAVRRHGRASPGPAAPRTRTPGAAAGRRRGPALAAAARRRDSDHRALGARSGGRRRGLTPPAAASIRRPARPAAVRQESGPPANRALAGH